MRPFAEYYNRLYNPSVKRKYYQAGVKLALDPELRASDQAAFELEQAAKAEKEAQKAAAKAQRREIAAAKKLARKAEDDEAQRTTKKLRLNARGGEAQSNGSPSTAPHEVPTVSSSITTVAKDKMELGRIF